MAKVNMIKIKSLRKIAYVFLAIGILMGVFTGYTPQPARATITAYNHIIPFTITDTSGVARTNVPVIITYDVSGKLVAYGLTNATCTDTYVDSTGASNSPVGDGTAYKYLMNSNNITCIIPSLPAFGSVTINLYTGYAPVQTTFPLIMGNGGYYSVNDSTSLNVTTNGTMSMNAYLGGTSGNLFNKPSAYNVSWNTTTSNVSSYISNPYQLSYISASTQYCHKDAGVSMTATTKMTLEGWARRSTDGVIKTIAGYGDWAAAATSGYILYFGTTGNITLSIENNAGGLASNWSSANVTDNVTTYFITATYDNTRTPKTVVYVNGSVWGGTDTGVGGTVNSPGTYLGIGAYYSGGWSSPMNGNIDEFRLSNIARTSAEHMAAYNSGLGLSFTLDSNTLSLFHFSEGTGNTTSDVAGSNNLALVNTPTWVNTSVVDTPGVSVSVATTQAEQTVTLSASANVSSWASGSVLHFDGTANSYVDIGVSYNASTKLYVSTWFYLDSAFNAGGGDQHLWSKRISGTDKLRLYLANADGKIHFESMAGGVDNFDMTSTQSTWNANTWYNVIASISNTAGARLIINNGTAITNPDTHAVPNGGNFVIGNNFVTATTGIIGYIQNVTIGTTDLTTAQEAAIYNGIAPATVTDYYYIDSGSGTTITSYGTSANTGTAGSACTWRTLTYTSGNTGRLCDFTIQAGTGRSGTNLKGISIPANSNNITICSSATNYMLSANITKGGNTGGLWQPTALITNNNLPDNSGNGNTGKITWGVNTNITVTAGDIMTSNSATSVSTTSVMMQGNLFFIGTFTSVYLSFQYGLDTTYGYFTSETAATVAGAFSVTLTGLTPNTTYHYRAVARNGLVYAYGADISVTTSYSTSSQGSTTPLIITAAVFNGYATTNDTLVCAEAIVTYPPYYPTGTPSQYFQMQLLSTNGTILGASPIQMWGDRPECIYFNPTASSNLTFQAPYVVRIQNISSQNITFSANYTLKTTDWRGNDTTKLGDWCMGVAANMQNTDGTILTTPYLTTVSGTGTVISDYAGGYFNTGITNIQTLYPQFFQTGTGSFALTTLSNAQNYNSGSTLAGKVGNQIATDLGTIGSLFSLSAQNTAMYMVLAVVAFAVFYVVSQTQGFGALGALCIAIPILGTAAYLNMISIQIPIMLGVVFVFLFVRQFIWKTL